MGVINYSDQLKFTGKGYLDAKMMPVENVSDLKNISITQRFEGLTVTVLKDENGNVNPQDYWLIGGVTNSCWIPKTVSGYNKDLRLVLENGFLKLMDGDEPLGDEINLNEFFPSQPDNPGDFNDMYISSVDYVYLDDSNNEGVFLCFTYSDNTKKYLNMSQFLSQRYESGNGIVIEGNVIAMDNAMIRRIEGKVNKVDGSRLMTEVEGAKLETISEGAEVNIIESININGINTSIDSESKSASITLNSNNIEIGEDIKNGENIEYSENTKISTVLQGIQNSIKNAISNSINSVSGDNNVIIVDNTNINNPIISLNIEKSTDMTISEGHIEIVRDGDGIYAAMYYSGDDTE